MIFNKIKILLVEDDKSLGETLRDRLELEGYNSILAQTKKSAIKEFESEEFDLIILDIGLPDGDGFELAKEISKTANPPPFLFLTALAGAEERLKGFELGAEEFIPKPFHLKELLLRVKHVLQIHKREKIESVPDNLKFDSYEILFNSFEIITPTKEKVKLVPRDAYLLKYLITYKERVVSRDEILDKLWGEDKFPTNRTIDNAIVRLRQVLGEKGKDAIESIRGVGYRWKGNLNQ